MKRLALITFLAWAALDAPALNAQVDATVPYARDQILVRFPGSVPDAQAAATIAAIGATIEESFSIVNGLYLVRLPATLTPAAAIAALEGRGALYAEPNYLLSIAATPNDQYFGSLWGLHNTGQASGQADADIDAPEAWDITTGSATVVVAVIDTGIDYTHPDLAANMVRLETNCSDGVDDDGNGYVDDCYGIDTVGVGDTNPMDDHLHGTHVAGTIGAVGNNGVGVTGVAWNVRLMACKFLNSGGSGVTSDAIQCLQYIKLMRDRGVNIVATNNSWGGGGFDQALQDAIDAQRQSDILFIAAAGNAARDNDSNDFYPANYFLPNIISVASTTRTDALSSFSNYGAQSVHIGAPGSDILSTTPGNNYLSLNGTSMATPHVSGVAALLEAQNPSRDWRAIRNLILAGGVTTSALTGRSATGRRLNAHGSLTCADSVVRSRLQPAGSSYLTSVDQTFTLAALHINCAAPAGTITVTSSSGQSYSLLDDGVSPDQIAGDGVYTTQASVSSYGVHTLTFPGGDTVNVQVLRPYTSQSTSYEYRSFTGTSLDVPLDNVRTLDTPFPIRFGGGSFSRLHVTPNGIVGVSAPHADWFNVSMPLALRKAFVAAFWDDLYPTWPTQGTTKNVFWTATGTTPNRELVIEWRNLQHYDCRSDASLGVTFQVVFFENSTRVLVNYADTIMGGACAASDRGGSATIGVQTGTSAGTQFSSNTASVNSGTALLWTSSSAFTDTSLSGVAIKAVHITELRSRIDALRTARGLGAFNWTTPSLTAGDSVARAVHVTELRTALNEAYVAAGRTAPTYTDTLAATSTLIRAIHLTELRSAVTALE